MRNLIFLLFFTLPSILTAQEFDGICLIKSENSSWSGVMTEQGVLTVAHPDKKESVCFFSDGANLVGVPGTLIKKNDQVDIAIYRVEVPKWAKVKKHKIGKIKAPSATIIGYIGGTRTIRSGQYVSDGVVNGVTVVTYGCQATSGMSGSPAFYNEEVIGIQFGGNSTSTDCVSVEEINKFLELK